MSASGCAINHAERLAKYLETGRMSAGRRSNREILAALALFACGLAASPALADVKAGVDAWTGGDFEAAVKEWKAPAAKGDADAQFNLGQAYKLGRGVKQDLKMAEELYAKAANQGHMQASDNYGLLLFQRGERTKALPYVVSAAERGDPRAQYLIGLAHFNGDVMPRDWPRAYALVSLAQQAGLPMAAGALAQMDQHIPLEERQQSVPLAQELAAQAEATRGRQLAAVDLGSTPQSAHSTLPELPPAPTVAAGEPVMPQPVEVGGAEQAGADYARPGVPAIVTRPAAMPVPVIPKPAIAAAPRPVTPRPAAAAPAPATSGPWRVQIGAFGVAANADAMWNRVKSRPEVGGRGKVLVPAGSVTKLMIGGFASEAAARSTCSQLSAGGVSCLVVKN
jgi:uncharacterized protein